MLIRLFRGVEVLEGLGRAKGDRWPMHEPCHGHNNESYHGSTIDKIGHDRSHGASLDKYGS